MNYSMIIYIIGWVLNLEAVFLALPCVTAVIYGESQGFAFLATMVGTAIVGIALTRKKPENTAFYVREGFVTVALCWIVLSMVGGLPFTLNGDIPSYLDAVFETVSGFTTTGASILFSVEALAHCSLMWRSFTHWVGGMGVLVFLLAIVPMAGGGTMNLMRAESPGPSVSKLVPRVKETAYLLYKIYAIITLVEIVILFVSGMPLFDSLTLSFGTAGTGGFGVRNDSIASYTTFQINTITLFMIMFGVNFNVYYLMYTKKFRKAFECEEARWYLGIIFAAIFTITINVRHMFPSIGETLKHVAFQVGSIITTTGYSTADFDLWPQLSRTILVVLMFIGACAGSTGGGMKVSRVILLMKTIKKELNYYIHPRSVKKIQFEGKPVEHETQRSVNVFLATYFIVFTVSVLVVALDEFDLVTNFTAVAATFNNIGPGLSKVGPTMNFALFSPLSKLVLIFDMLAGRLEIFPMLLILYPKTWMKF